MLCFCIAHNMEKDPQYTVITGVHYERTKEAQLLLNRLTDTDETLHSCSIWPKDVHEGR